MSRALSDGTPEARKALGLDGYTEEDVFGGRGHVTEGERDALYQGNTILLVGRRGYRTIG